MKNFITLGIISASIATSAVSSANSERRAYLKSAPGAEEIVNNRTAQNNKKRLMHLRPKSEFGKFRVVPNPKSE